MSRISAGELRAMGAEIDPKVPDCATCRASCIVPSAAQISEDGQSMLVGFDLVGAEFSWVEASVLVQRPDA